MDHRDAADSGVGRIGESMKDWKAECEKLKGVIQELQSQITYERDLRRRREDEDRDIRNRLKELLIDVLQK